MSAPLLSIVMPSYNQGRFLREALDSIFSQSYRPLEVIVVDGASSDDSCAILADYAARHPELRWISEKDQGPADAVNKGLAMMRGELAGICSSDDLYCPGALEQVVRTAQAHPDCGFIYGDVAGVDERGAALGEGCLPGFSWPAFFAISLALPQGSIFFRTRLAREVGGWNASYYSCDIDYWLRMLFRARARQGSGGVVALAHARRPTYPPGPLHPAAARLRAHDRGIAGPARRLAAHAAHGASQRALMGPDRSPGQPLVGAPRRPRRLAAAPRLSAAPAASAPAAPDPGLEAVPGLAGAATPHPLCHPGADMSLKEKVDNGAQAAATVAALTPSRRRLLLGLALLGMLCWVGFGAALDPQALLAALAGLGRRGIAGVVMLSLLNYLLRFARWHWFLGRLGYPLRLRRHLLIYFAGFSLTVSPGKAGEAAALAVPAPLGVGYGASLAALFAPSACSTCWPSRCWRP